MVPQDRMLCIFCRLVFAYFGLCLLLASAAGLLFVTRAVWLEALGDAWGRLAGQTRRGYGRHMDAEADRVGLMGMGSRSKAGSRGLPPVVTNGGAVDEELGDPFDATDDASGAGQRGLQMDSISSSAVFAGDVGGSQRANGGAAAVNGDHKGHEADKGPVR